MKKTRSVDTVQYPRTLLLGIDAPYNKTRNMQAYFDEFLHLVESNNIPFDAKTFIKIRTVDSAYFLTKGKLEEIRELCEKENIEEVIVSEPLSAQQERNLSELLHAKVFDRTQLILEIFEKSAHSAEGKMQVAIAMFNHQKSRVAGKGINMSQQAGHIGGRGPGETAKEKELRHLERYITKCKQELKDIQKIRENQRKRRLESRVPHICLIGYTNTGKSTILNLLTNAQVLAADQLFATLDTTTRELYINGTKKGVISDTVGFIQQLPTQLIDAFKSTLDELNYADLLLQIVDSSDASWKEHVVIVQKILNELGIKKDMVYVFNKADIPTDTPITPEEREQFEPHVVVSAKSKQGIQPLVDFLATWEKKETN
jgi:GTP-binding protein HflX